MEKFIQAVDSELASCMVVVVVVVVMRYKYLALLVQVWWLVWVNYVHLAT